jgi:thioredoxin reductase (NADPH)
MGGTGDWHALILGGGPAGMVTAALLAEDGWRVGLIDGLPGGGRTMVMETVHDLPAAGVHTAGPALASRLLDRTMDAQVEVIAEQARAVHAGPARHRVELDSTTLTAPVVVVATGTSQGRLDVPGEEQLLGRGISHCASCDAPLYAGQEVLLVGNGDWAIEEALTLAAYASRVTLVVPDDGLCCARVRARRLRACSTVEVLAETRVVGIDAEGGEQLVSVRLRQAGREWAAVVRAVVPHIGQRPNTGLVAPEVARDEGGYLITDETRTTVNGIFGAGDVTRPNNQTIASAVADAVIAARSASAYLGDR